MVDICPNFWASNWTTQSQRTISDAVLGYGISNRIKHIFPLNFSGIPTVIMYYYQQTYGIMLQAKQDMHIHGNLWRYDDLYGMRA